MKVKRGHLIVTKYHGPTSHRGARVSARSFNKRAWVSWDDDLDMVANHDRAVRELCESIGVNHGAFTFARAETHDATGFAYIREV
jgi:hypothetical protein